MVRSKPSLADRIFRALLRAFPEEFRGQFGREMEQGFRDERNEKARGGATIELIKLWALTVADIFRAAPREHMDILGKDIAYGFRAMRRNWSLTVVSVLALALGIGANTAIFSVVDSVLLRPLPFAEPERIVVIKEWTNRGQAQVTPANFLDWREQTSSFEQMAAISTRRANLTSAAAESQRVNVAVTSANFFQALGVQPLLGRGFLPAEEQAGHDPVAILSYRLWESRFGSDPDLVGRTLNINGESHTVIAVMPPRVQYPKETDLWLPPRRIVPEPDFDMGDITQVRGMGMLAVIARLKPGVSVEQAQADMDEVTSRLRQQYPESNSYRFDTVISLHESLVGDVRLILLILLAAVGCVLLIACANVANLLLARSMARRKEFAIRIALGASRFRLIRQLLTESLMLALAGGAVGLLLGLIGVSLLTRLAQSSIPRLEEVGLDARVLGFTLLISLLTGIIFGLAPALQVAKANPNDAIKEGGRGSTGSKREISIRGALVVAEVALSLVLLICAGLLFRSFLTLRAIEPGFNPRGVLTMRIAPSGRNYLDARQRQAFYVDVTHRLQNIPGVESVGAISTLPMSKGPFNGYVIEGQPPVTADKMPGANRRHISPDYFRAMGVPLLRGREFTERDSLGATGVVIVNEALARHAFDYQDPIGKRIAFSWRDGQPVWLEIVGVVDNVRSIELNAEPMAEAYMSYLQGDVPELSFVIRALGDAANIGPAVRSEVAAVDREQPISNLKTMDEVVSESLTQPELNMTLLAIFSGVALVLAAAGIYGVMAYSVAQRTHEIGIRIALGAKPGNVLVMVLRQGARLTLLGTIIGLGGALLAARALGNLLFGISPTDLPTFIGVAILLAGVSLVACYLPALRATKVDPMIALRQE